MNRALALAWVAAMCMRVATAGELAETDAAARAAGVEVLSTR